MRTPLEMLRRVVPSKKIRAYSRPLRKGGYKHRLLLHLSLICAAMIAVGVVTTRHTRGMAPPSAVPAAQKQAPGLIPRINPFSRANIERALQALGRPGPGPISRPGKLTCDRQ